MENNLVKVDKFGDFLTLIGRFLIGGVFLIYGFQKISSFSATKSYMESVGFFWVSFFLVLTIILEIGGGFLLIIGYKTKIIACLLAIYILILTPIFHNPFNSGQFINFSKNLMIIGGLLFINTFGAGGASIDSKLLKNS